MNSDNTNALESTLKITVQIAAAYLDNNSLPHGTVPVLLRDIHAALRGLGSTGDMSMPEMQPVVPIKKSVTPDYIVCLEDGKKLTMLKRYLRSRFDMTPEQYRARWGLPHDYPMSAPNYSARRSALAKESGLGRRSKKTRRKRK